MTTKAIYEKGALHPLEPLDLSEGAEVEVIVQASESRVSEANWTPELAWQAMKEIQELSGEAKGDDPHAARDHDHHLYCARRRS